MENLARIEAIWGDCRARYGGPFLFGKTFGNADAMYAPVVARFHNYGLPVKPETRAYMDAVMALPAWREWYDAAMQETWIMQHNEPDWPLVRGKPVEVTALAPPEPSVTAVRGRAFSSLGADAIVAAAPAPEARGKLGRCLRFRCTHGRNAAIRQKR